MNSCLICFIFNFIVVPCFVFISVNLVLVQVTCTWYLYNVYLKSVQVGFLVANLQNGMTCKLKLSILLRFWTSYWAYKWWWLCKTRVYIRWRLRELDRICTFINSVVIFGARFEMLCVLGAKCEYVQCCNVAETDQRLVFDIESTQDVWWVTDGAASTCLPGQH